MCPRTRRQTRPKRPEIRNGEQYKSSTSLRSRRPRGANPRAAPSLGLRTHLRLRVLVRAVALARLALRIPSRIRQRNPGRGLQTPDRPRPRPASLPPQSSPLTCLVRPRTRQGSRARQSTLVRQRADPWHRSTRAGCHRGALTASLWLPLWPPPTLREASRSPRANNT